MPTAKDPDLERMRAICLALPDTQETPTWGKPHFRVGEKIFAGYGEERGTVAAGFKLAMDHAAAIVKEPGFERAPYVGHKGWVSVDLRVVRDWDRIRELVLESYRLIAPKRSLAKLAGPAAAKPGKSLGERIAAAAAKRTAARPASRKAAAAGQAGRTTKGNTTKARTRSATSTGTGSGTGTKRARSR